MQNAEGQIDLRVAELLEQRDRFGMVSERDRGSASPSPKPLLEDKGKPSLPFIHHYREVELPKEEARALRKFTESRARQQEPAPIHRFVASSAAESPWSSARSAGAGDPILYSHTGDSSHPHSEILLWGSSPNQLAPPNAVQRPFSSSYANSLVNYSLASPNHPRTAAGSVSGSEQRVIDEDPIHLPPIQHHAQTTVTTVPAPIAVMPSILNPSTSPRATQQRQDSLRSMGSWTHPDNTVGQAPIAAEQTNSPGAIDSDRDIPGPSSKGRRFPDIKLRTIYPHSKDFSRGRAPGNPDNKKPIKGRAIRQAFPPKDMRPKDIANLIGQRDKDIAGEGDVTGNNLATLTRAKKYQVARNGQEFEISGDALRHWGGPKDMRPESLDRLSREMGQRRSTLPAPPQPLPSTGGRFNKDFYALDKEVFYYTPVEITPVENRGRTLQRQDSMEPVSSRHAEKQPAATSPGRHSSTSSSEREPEQAMTDPAQASSSTTHKPGRKRGERKGSADYSDTSAARKRRRLADSKARERTRKEDLLARAGIQVNVPRRTASEERGFSAQVDAGTDVAEQKRIRGRLNKARRKQYEDNALVQARLKLNIAPGEYE